MYFESESHFFRKFFFIALLPDPDVMFFENIFAKKFGGEKK
jgi:hypothetical protein